MPHKMMKDGYVGARIAFLRVQKNWSQEILSAKLQTAGCDMSRGTIAKIECGARNIFAHEMYFFKTVLESTYGDLLDPLPEQKNKTGD